MCFRPITSQTIVTHPGTHMGFLTYPLVKPGNMVYASQSAGFREPGTRVLKSPIGRENGKSTDANISAMKIHQPHAVVTNKHAPEAYDPPLACVSRQGQINWQNCHSSYLEQLRSIGGIFEVSTGQRPIRTGDQTKGQDKRKEYDDKRNVGPDRANQKDKAEDRHGKGIEA